MSEKKTAVKVSKRMKNLIERLELAAANCACPCDCPKKAEELKAILGKERAKLTNAVAALEEKCKGC